MQMQAQQDAKTLQSLPSSSGTLAIHADTDANPSTVHKAPAPTRRQGRGRAGNTKNTKSKTRGATARGATSRCTRSQAAPQWTLGETLVLVKEIALLDEDWLKALSSYQRWKMISDSCNAQNVTRSSNQCKKRWNYLVSEYKKISVWESIHVSTTESYWALQPSARKQFQLPASFDQEVYVSMDAVVKAQEALNASAAADTDSEDISGLPEKAESDSSYNSEDLLETEASDSDYLVALPESKGQAEEIIGMLDAEMAAADEDSGPVETATKTVKISNKELEATSKLHESAKEIHAILRGELPDNISQVRGPVDFTKPNAIETEFTRRQADQLIKVFGVLVSTLDEFTDGLGLMSSVAL